MKVGERRTGAFLEAPVFIARERCIRPRLVLVLEDGELIVGGDVWGLLGLALVQIVDVALNLFVRK
jgi:hypothetical protein